MIPELYEIFDNLNISRENPDDTIEIIDNWNPPIQNLDTSAVSAVSATPTVLNTSDSTVTLYVDEPRDQDITIISGTTLDLNDIHAPRGTTRLPRNPCYEDRYDSECDSDSQSDSECEISTDLNASLDISLEFTGPHMPTFPWDSDIQISMTVQDIATRHAHTNVAVWTAYTVAPSSPALHTD